MDATPTEDLSVKQGGLIGLRVLLFSMAILGTMIIMAGSSSYLIQAGKLTDATINGEIHQVYQALEQTPHCWLQ